MSGGLDSSVCAALLKKRGFEVTGVFMKLWALDHQKIENRCCNHNALERAYRVAGVLKIPFYTIDLVKEFKKYVVDYYLKEYSRFRTPNPCVVCNKLIKFEFLLKKARAFGMDYLATGHYVRLKGEKPIRVFQAKDKIKDQSYFLWALTQDQLRYLLFPIGEYTKDEVRKMAKKWNLPTAQQEESQGLCFIGYGDNQEFLKKFIKAVPGPIKDLKGNVLGQHRGLPFYTIGQRKGIEIEIKTPYTPPLYVLRLEPKDNSLIVGEEKDLYQKELYVEGVNWINKPSQTDRIKAKIRYGHPSISCYLSFIKNDKLKVVFKKPVRAITPGQSIVFYRDEEVLGGGVIVS